MTVQIILVAAGYLIGSIPFGYVYSLWIKGENIREHGSGNIGATNIIREYGWLPGLVTLVLDALKGAAPAGFSFYVLFPDHIGFGMLVGAAAILGHVFPLYLNFSGGKGVATSAGVFLTLAPGATLVALFVFFIGVGSTRYMSVGSLSGALALPVASLILNGTGHPLTLGATVLGALVYWRHRENIKRLYRGEENKFF